MFWVVLIVSVAIAACEQGGTLTCMKVPSFYLKRIYVIKPRRYDIGHMGRTNYFRGWADVQGQGAANDFCRVVGNIEELVLACALAGTSGENERNYNTAKKFEPGLKETWYMKDEDGDGRDDYCRCVKDKVTNVSQVWCTRAGPNGFYGSPDQGGDEFTFSMSGTENCEKQRVRPEFGKKYPV